MSTIAAQVFEAVKALSEEQAAEVLDFARFLQARGGRKGAVSLPMEEYDALMERLEDMEDLADAREALGRLDKGLEKPIPWDSIKGEYGL